jgi:hypothetical protein
VEERVPHLSSEGGSYRLAPVTDVSTVREATATSASSYSSLAPRGLGCD